MIITRKRLLTAIQWDRYWERYKRCSTGEHVDFPQADDVIQNPDGTYGEVLGINDIATEALIVQSRLQMRKEFRAQCIANFVAAGVFLALMVWQIFESSRVWYAGEAKWTTFLGVAAFAVLSCLYLSQAINPIVHDMDGHWVNLRTGSTNLNGGGRLLTKEDHVPAE